MRRLWIAIVWLAASFGGGKPAAATPTGRELRLVGAVDDRLLVEIEAEDSRLVSLDETGNRHDVPDNVVWRLDGSLADAANLFDCAPDYQIRQVPVVDPAQPFRAAWFAVIEVAANAPWTRVQMTGGLVVVVWVVDQKPVWVVPLTTELHSGEFRHRAVVLGRELAPGEERGYPVVALRKEGHWVSPSPLFARAGHDSAVKALAFASDGEMRRALAEVDGVDRHAKRGGDTLLRLAATMGRTAAVRGLIARRAKLEASGEGEWTPLWSAAGNGRLEALAVILDASRSLRGAGWGRSQWSTVVKRAQLGAARALLQERPGFAGTSALAAALWVADADAAIDLLEMGVELNVGRLDPGLVQRGVALGEPRLVDALLRAGLLTEEPTEGLTEPWLITAVRSGRVASVERLLAAGFDPNSADVAGRTPLIWAVLTRNAAMVATLRREGANPELKDRRGARPQDYAVARGDEAVWRALCGDDAAPPAAFTEPAGEAATPRVWPEAEADHVPRLLNLTNISTAERVPAQFTHYVAWQTYGAGDVMVREHVGHELDEPSKLANSGGGWAVYSVVVRADGSVLHATLVALAENCPAAPFQKALADARFDPGERDAVPIATRMTLTLYSL